MITDFNSRSFDLLNRLAMATTLEGANTIMDVYCRQMGFQSFVYGYACFEYDLICQPSISFSTTLDDDLLAIYFAEGGASNDPIAERLFNLDKPEIHDNVHYLLDPNSKFRSHKFLHASLDIDLDLGILVPLRGENGAGSFLAYAGATTRTERRKIVINGLKSGLVEAAELFHEFVRGQGLLKDNYALTAAELDTLKYIAEGKTIGALSSRFRISERAVDKRLAKARNKLCARTTANAVYRATILGLV